jgi:hypothetical protein
MRTLERARKVYIHVITLVKHADSIGTSGNVRKVYQFLVANGGEGNGASLSQRGQELLAGEPGSLVDLDFVPAFSARPAASRPAGGDKGPAAATRATASATSTTRVASTSGNDEECEPLNRSMRHVVVLLYVNVTVLTVLTIFLTLPALTSFSLEALAAVAGMLVATTLVFEGLESSLKDVVVITNLRGMIEPQRKVASSPRSTDTF